MAIVKNGEHQGDVPVFENFYLIEGRDRKEAESLAQEIGRLEAKASDRTSYEDQPAEVLFLGIRKLREVFTQKHSGPLVHGDELTHSFYHVRSLNDARKLASGGVVDLTYVDDDDTA